jgi:hypothetical protein
MAGVGSGISCVCDAAGWYSMRCGAVLIGGRKVVCLSVRLCSTVRRYACRYGAGGMGRVGCVRESCFQVMSDRVCANMVRAGDAWFASDRATRQTKAPDDDDSSSSWCMWCYDAACQASAPPFCLPSCNTASCYILYASPARLPADQAPQQH